MINVNGGAGKAVTAIESCKRSAWFCFRSVLYQRHVVHRVVLSCRRLRADDPQGIDKLRDMFRKRSDGMLAGDGRELYEGENPRRPGEDQKEGLVEYKAV